MKIIWYILTVFFGAIGLLALIRALERMISGAEVSTPQIFVAVLLLLLAAVSVRQARSAS
jgi:Co/Zn/Cd efflux system component